MGKDEKSRNNKLANSEIQKGNSEIKTARKKEIHKEIHKKERKKICRNT